MKKRVYRIFLDYEKEEAWVNDMAAHGWDLKKTSLGYFVFEKGEAGQYIYRNELVKGKNKDYFEFLETMNIECVSKFAGWAYYRKKASEGPFELFSDNSSKIHYLQSLNRLFIPLALFNLFMSITNFSLGLTVNLLNSAMGFINFLVAITMCILILKIEKRKKGLQHELHIFEG